MPAPVLHVGAVVTCSHAGPAQPVAPFARVLVSGQPVVTIASPYAVTGCTLSAGGSPPCVTGQWLTGAVRVLAGGQPLATMAGASTCVPTATPLMPISAQPRVLAT
ncbi:MAG: hypothetical protein QOI64_2303 [Solirubrobacteraceae bacterium]|jgi:hypothetical protein|nr:hypothetical protein [Solirubrobacteraceae bacterium]